jgi:ABC-type amino acid transport substrate-binding protein
VNKNLPKLKEALSVALSEAMMDGSYQALLKKYGVPESAYTSQ